MAVLRLIEVETIEELNGIPYRNGQVLYVRHDARVYWDIPNGVRTKSDIIIKVAQLPSNGDITKVYYLISDNKLYRYDGANYYILENTVEIFDLISTQEDVYSAYMRYANRLFSPIVSSETVLRPNGDYVEDTITEHELEFLRLLNPYERRIIPVQDNQTILLLPLPYKSYLIEGNTFSVYKNNVLLVEQNDYTIDYTNSTITLKNPITINTDIRVIFHYVNTELNVAQEYFITTDKTDTVFTLQHNKYFVGKGMTSLFINGIKQPKEAYVESSQTTITLNGQIPKGSLVLIEIGKLLPRPLE